MNLSNAVNAVSWY